jgi:hypothetical protein
LEVQAEQGDPEAILELEGLPSLPRFGARLWGWFLELHATRQIGAMGSLNRLTREEIARWADEELGRSLTMWERQTLMALDAEWLAVSHSQQSKRNRNREGGKKP